MSLTGLVTLVTLNRLFLSKSHKGDALALCIGTSIRTVKKARLGNRANISPIPAMVWSGSGFSSPGREPLLLRESHFFRD
jgi:hypothetical protein